MLSSYFQPTDQIIQQVMPKEHRTVEICDRTNAADEYCK
jgi:hypothetical protein